MKIYLIRHGQTDWNLAKRVQGRTDNPLNETGIRQAEQLKEKLQAYSFDICYASPLKRALQTAEIIVNNRVPIILDDNLEERDFGNLEGEVLESWDKEVFDRKLNSGRYGMEPIKNVLTRSKKVLERIKNENTPDSNVLIVAHDILLKTMHFNIIGYDDDTDFSTFHFENGAISEYDI